MINQDWKIQDWCKKKIKFIMFYIKKIVLFGEFIGQMETRIERDFCRGKWQFLLKFYLADE